MQYDDRGSNEYYDIPPILYTLTDAADIVVGLALADAFKNGRNLYCPKGSYLTLYDDQQVYMNGLIRFIEDVEKGSFP